MDDKLEVASQRISPKEYKKIVDSIHLAEISLIELSATVSRTKLMQLEKPRFRLYDNFEIDHSEDFYRLKGNFQVDVPKKGRGENPLKIVATYSVRFDGPDKIPEDFWILYKEMLLPFQIWPYFRELVQSLTGRMNIPPITLPIIHQ